MAKRKNIQSVTAAAREAGKQLATWGAVEVMARKALAESEQRAQSADFAEFLFSGEGSRGIIRIGSTVCRIEG